eukprot:553233_1
MELATLNAKERSGIVWEYWFRQIMTKNYKSISINVITKIIVEYYSNVIAYNGKFLKENCGKGIIPLNDHEVQFYADKPGGAYKSAKLDTPIYCNSKNVCVWQIMIDCKEGRIGGFDMIGVVSDKCDNIGRCPWGGLIDCFGISASTHLWLGTTNNFTPDKTRKKDIINKEIVRIELDIELSELAFKIDDEMLSDPIKLPNREAWYPVISLSFPTRKMNAKFIPVQE